MRYVEVLREHRDLLARLTGKVAVPRLRRVYERAQSELEAKLSDLTRRGRGDTMTAHQHRVMLLQVRQAQAELARQMGQELSVTSKQAQVESVHKLNRDVSRLDARFTGAATVLPTEQAARFAGVVDRRHTSLVRMHATSMARYGARVAGAMEEQLTLSLVTGETPRDAVQRVVDVADSEWWQGERIVRTEMAWAFSASQRDAIVDAHREDPGLWMRWTEHCSDNGAPLDDRVGVDSMAMHGQVARPGASFTMPPSAPNGEPVSASLVGRSWEFPPNRPNDRANLAPWKPAWGSRGWEWRGGRRTPVRA